MPSCFPMSPSNSSIQEPRQKSWPSRGCGFIPRVVRTLPDLYLKTASTLEAFRRIFGRTLVQQTHLIDSNYDSLRIEGFLSLIGAPTKV